MMMATNHVFRTSLYQYILNDPSASIKRVNHRISHGNAGTSGRFGMLTLRPCAICQTVSATYSTQCQRGEGSGQEMARAVRALKPDADTIID